MNSIVTHLAWKPKPMMEVEAVSRELTLTFVTAAAAQHRPGRAGRKEPTRGGAGTQLRNSAAVRVTESNNNPT